MAKARSDPKEMMEGDLVVATVGLVIIVMGGVVAVAGVHPRWQSIHQNSPAPLLGTIIAIAGMVIVVLGVVMLLVNVVIWLSGRLRRRGPSDRSPFDEVESIVRDQHLDEGERVALRVDEHRFAASAFDCFDRQAVRSAVRNVGDRPIEVRHRKGDQSVPCPTRISNEVEPRSFSRSPHDLIVVHHNVWRSSEDGLVP
jgi:hypothetical protein